MRLAGTTWVNKNRAFGRLALAAAFLALGAAGASAQLGPAQGSGPRGPIRIESENLEVKDKEKIATFSGDVRATQDDAVLECKILIVYYDQETPAAGSAPAQAGQPAAPGSGQIRRLEAKGGVILTQKDQTATGDEGLFEVKTNQVTLMGNVVVTQNGNVIKGDTLWADLTTGVSRVESKGPNGKRRVQGLFNPGQQSTPAAAPATRQRGTSNTARPPRTVAQARSRPAASPRVN